MSNHARSLLPALAAAWLLAAPEARASAPGTYGMGSRTGALAGAVTADAADFSGCFYNPAGLVSAPGLELSVGYLYADNRLRINGKDNDVADVHGLMAGIVAPGKILSLPFAFGIATYIPDNGLSRIRALRQETPRWELYNDRPTILFLSVHLAVRPLPWLELGGGLAFLAATRGRFGIRGEEGEAAADFEPRERANGEVDREEQDGGPVVVELPARRLLAEGADAGEAVVGDVRGDAERERKREDLARRDDARHEAVDIGDVVVLAVDAEAVVRVEVADREFEA
ncbi:MAG TPA: hypothetical protein VM694_12575, partial [Polyangium sp.]|nr:hypothetical protein [Polyangium sp.]